MAQATTLEKISFFRRQGGGDIVFRKKIETLGFGEILQILNLFSRRNKTFTFILTDNDLQKNYKSSQSTVHKKTI
jgi:hypothetical protein